jgi:hypothetical protein
MSAVSHWFTTLVAFQLAVATAIHAPWTSAPELPTTIRAELSAAYPGWRFARLHPALRHELRSDDSRRRSTEWVAGDFDGNRRRDYAVQIVRPGPADSIQLVVAFLAGDRGQYQASVITAGGEHMGTILTTAGRGERVTDYDKGTMGDSTFVLAYDAVVLLINEGGGITCLYERGRWRCVVSGD